jgi:hypothetical protein
MRFKYLRILEASKSIELGIRNREFKGNWGLYCSKKAEKLAFTDT